MIIILITIIINSLCLSSTLTTNTDCILGKKLNYNLEFKGISAGSAFIKVIDDLDNNKRLILNSELKTNRFTDFFYKIRDYITVSMNKDDISLVTLYKDINEGNFHKKYHVEVKEDTIKNLIDNINLFINEKIYSPLSIVYALRKNKLNIKSDSKILVFGCEGATDKQIYEKLIKIGEQMI